MGFSMKIVQPLHGLGWLQNPGINKIPLSYD